MEPARRQRQPLGSRKHASRQAARARIATRARSSLTPEQRALDPLRRGERSRARRIGLAGLALLGALAVHALVLGAGILGRGSDPSRRAQMDVRHEVKVEVREKVVVSPPPLVVPEPPRPPPVEKAVRPAPRVVRVEPPPPSPSPKEGPKTPPPRVVGLSLESTTEGGAGPAFAVGNTRAGQTAPRAVSPKDVPPPVDSPPGEPAGTGNQAASRIPVAGVKYTMPRRKRTGKPPYPETLKTQGLEADVTVMVSLDAAGKVTAVKVIRPSPYPEFNDAAMTFARAEEYDPATRDGSPIPYTLSFTIRFRLEDQ